MGIRQNFGYNLILTLCNYLCPLITFPYVSRVLGEIQVGVCGFVDAIVNYFVIFSMLGVGSYGIREIARCGDNKEQRNIVFTNLMLINIILTIFAVAILLVCTFYIPQLQQYKELLGVGIIKIVFSVFIIEWLFQGVERFKYITLRSVTVNLLYVLSVLLFVRNSSDTLIYYFLTTLVVAVNALLNWYNSRRFRKWNFKSIDIRTYLKPVLTFGYYKILTSMYTTFNVIFLGFVSGDAQAGYFVTATKLYTILMAAFTAFTTIMVPRVSVMLASKEYTKLQRLSDEIFEILFSITLPVIFFALFYASQIIDIVAGDGYEGAVLPFRIVIFLLTIIGMEQIVIQQFLMASSSNRSIMMVSTIGAITGVGINILFTPSLGAVGSAIAWSVSEVMVLLVGVYFMKICTTVTLNYKNLLNALFWCLPYIVLDLFLYLTVIPSIGIWLALLSNIMLFIVLNFVLNRNAVFIKLLQPLLNKLKL